MINVKRLEGEARSGLDWSYRVAIIANSRNSRVHAMHARCT